MELKDEMIRARADLDAVEAEIGKVIVGQREVVRLLLAAVFADGHVLLEGLPGTGKTLLVTTLRDVLHLAYSRVQFTPDLMPADITGTNVIEIGGSGDKRFRFEPGPVFTNLLLADEINRASPKTQSALLQAMQEREITVFGQHFRIEEPFITVATQNPIEMEGTYPLPEAQLDRFLFKLVLPASSLDDLVEIAVRTTGPQTLKIEKIIDRERLRQIRDLIARVPVAEPVMRSAARLVRATNPGSPEAPDITRRLVRYGSSTRGLQGLIVAAKVRAVREGRFHVAVEDILAHVKPVLRHRIILNFEGELQKVPIDDLLDQILATVRLEG